MRKVLLLFCVGLVFSSVKAQLLTWTPGFAKDNDNITITVDASYGNQGLLNYSGNVYVHVGLITNLSTGPTNWQHVLFIWASAPAAAQATAAGTNKWSYTINNIRSFFSVGAGETIYKIAILFRDAAGNIVQRNSDASDMYVPVYDNNLAVRFSAPPFQPRYVPIPEPISKQVGDNLAVTGIASQTSDMKLYLNGTVFHTAAGVAQISGNPTLTTTGNNEIVVEATASSVTRRDTLRFFVSSAVNIAPLPAGVRTGINYAPNNTDVTLVLYAPGKTRISVIGEFPGSNWVEQTQYVMNKTPDGNTWWITITGLTPGTEYAYQYLVDGNLTIADPYAEKILDPDNDLYIPASTYPNLKPFPSTLADGIVSVLQTNAPGYTWVNNSFSRPDKRNLFIYEMLLRDFLAAHDWKTLKDTISYFKRLGINAIEIMPFNEFEGNESWGYNPDFYFAPDKYYGPKNTLKEFIDICHTNGIAVIMDIALNHSFGLSPLVQLYWDPVKNRPAANNPWFNPVPKHAFNVGYDMNHESPATQYYFSRIVEHWLQEYRIDGFRFDLSKGFTQTQTCDVNGLNCNVSSWSNYDASRVAIWKRYYDTLQLKSPGSYAILEHFAADAEEIDLSNYGMLLWGNMNDQFAQAAMAYSTPSPGGNTWNFERGIFSARNWTKPQLVTYMESHDEERLAYKNINFGNSFGGYSTRDSAISVGRLGLCASFFMSIPGPKMIWQFGELGYDYSINYCTNGTVNNNCRLDNKPIRWDYRNLARRQGLFNIYRAMAALRANSGYRDVFTANNITIERDLAGGIKWLKLRSASDTADLLVVGNFDIQAQTGSVTFPVTGTWYDYLNGTTVTASAGSQSVTLQPGEYHVYLNRNLANVVTTPVIDLNNPPADLVAMVYPNPVSGASVVETYIPETGNVRMEIWNMTGQRVQTVYSGRLTKGVHIQHLSGKTDALPAGIYLLKLTAGTRVQTIRLLIP